MSFAIGDQVGDYRIVGTVGSGGAGRVFRVEHAITGRVEAMKVLLETRTDSAVPAERFQREIKVQAKLDHPGIASIHNAFWANEELVMIMELVGGSSLDKLIATGPAKIGPALRFGMQSLAALEYAHKQGVTHRDVKPENIMVTTDGRVKLMDFGLAKATKDTKLTQMGSVIGSVFYISPEQARGRAEVDHRTDIYSFGAVLYELVTGRKPFVYDNTYALLQAAVEERPKPPKELRPDIPLGLNNAILRALAKNPADRFRTAEEFRAALEAVAADPHAVVAPSRVDPASHHDMPPAVTAHRRRRLLFVGAGLAAVIYLGLNYLSQSVLLSPGMASVEAGALNPDLGGYRAIRTISLGQTLSQISFSADGARLIAASGKSVRIIDVLSGETLGSFSDLGDSATDIRLSPDGRWAAAAKSGDEAVLWNAQTFAVVRRLTHAGRVTAVAFSSDSRYVATGSADRTLRIWDLENPGTTSVFAGPEDGPRALVFSPTAPLLASAAPDGAVQFWAIKREGSESLEGVMEDARGLRFSASGLELAAYGSNAIIVWDVPSRSVRTEQSLPGSLLALEKSSSRGWITIGSAAEEPSLGEIRSVSNGELILAIPHTSKISAAALSPGAGYFATATQGGTLTIWQPTRF